MDVVHIGSEEVKELLHGDMGIKEALVGSELVYQRPGGYVYIYLDTKENTNG